MKNIARPKVPARDPTAKTSPRGRVLVTDTKTRMDEQAVAREKLEALGRKRVDGKGKLGDSHDGDKLSGAIRRSRSLSQISESASPRSSSADVHIGKQYHQMNNSVFYA